MITYIIGMMLLIGCLYHSAQGSDLGNFFNFHAVSIVVGGTIAIFIIATPWKVLRTMMHIIREHFASEPNVNEVKTNLIEVANNPFVRHQSRDPLISYANQLWEQGIDHDLFVALISQKRSQLDTEHLDAIQALRNLAKYPPALGMTGTVMGLVTLFSKLGTESQAGLGPALALAMVATFFGLILANAIVMPLADRLQTAHLRQKRHLESVYQILLLVNRRESEKIIKDEVYEKFAVA